ncbi:TIGR01777 family oxidoreductase [Sulfurospirillum sp. T05]|uniref:TIGR01777 family oxidoreductase n=1 Tax=Sulfurospirillum tamanense TaxID=2813362 RepID=A0ABS2WRK3_9BACT|nr:TIGR01777 family oxidoreductase [Sulfurospirillum tamanensis]MBN2964293.1 TIGR01777 family oxidoreductase [Sulfurospirillum tamanensis]
MRIAMSGANGFVGSYLSKRFVESGHEIVAITRLALSDESALLATLKGCDGVINLAGANISERWTPSHKEAMVKSRINTTRAIVSALKAMQTPPKVLISTSAVGIYEAGKEHDETSNEFDQGFLGDLAKRWENEALRAKEAGVRVALFRFGVVFGRGGGALAKMMPIFKLGLGGVIGSGEQGFSWIHIEDLFRAYVWVLEDANKEGIYNLTAPHPVTNKEMTKALGAALNRPAFLPVPTFALKLKFGEGAVILLEGQKVYPKHLLDEGFSFFYPQIDQAFDAVIS